jgi:hypothetical protein
MILEELTFKVIYKPLKHLSLFLARAISSGVVFETLTSVPRKSLPASLLYSGHLYVNVFGDVPPNLLFLPSTPNFYFYEWGQTYTNRTVHI